MWFALPAPLIAALKRVAGDHVVGQKAAVAPAANPQSLGIGDTCRNEMIDTGQHVGDLEIAPVGKDGLAGFAPRPELPR